MVTKASDQVSEALGKLRSELKHKRGYGARIASKLKVNVTEVYNVSWGRTRDARILKALMDEAKSTKVPNEEYMGIIAEYLSVA